MQLASCHTKFLEDGFPKDGVEIVFMKFTCNTTQLGHKYKTIRAP